MVAEQVINSFVVIKGLMNSWIVMINLWQTEDFRSKDQIADDQFGSKKNEHKIC